ncbi:MAG: hypothetical protein IH623_17660 [Verrucomicrobia bacterium]|nr:hypothetical protein [Verrucomicrobiota bacterium]
MQTRPMNAAPVVAAGALSVFHVVVVYEDYAAGHHANETCNFLLSQLGDEFEVRCGMWKFDILRLPHLRQIAAAEASGADVVIVAGRGTSPLPSEVTQWVDGWLPGHSKRGVALIAILDVAANPLSVVPPAFAYLQQVATTADMEFFPHFMEFRRSNLPPPEDFIPPEVAAAQPANPPVSPMTDQHWGINE